MAAALATTAPAAFTAANFADRRSDVLYAKIRRGGMGTGMPNFGTLFTPAETWALVDYIWLLAFGDAPPGRD
jgi:mono/diheme cytochrome c family protein